MGFCHRANKLWERLNRNFILPTGHFWMGDLCSNRNEARSFEYVPLFCFWLFFSQFWFIFTLITLNFFSGRLPISLSFIWSYGFLQCSFICCMFLCLFLSFNLLCLESPFFRLEGLNSSLL